MADDPKKITEEEVRLEQAKENALKNQVGYQQSLVENLKEALGVRTKLTEGENTQLKLAKEIGRQLLNQKGYLSSVAEKKKTIEKNESLIQKSQLASSVIESKKLTIAKELASKAQEQAGELEKLSEQQLRAGNISEEVLQTAREKLDEAEVELDIQLEALSVAEKAALFEQQSVENLKKANVQRRAELETLEEIEERTGLAGKLLKGLSKIPGFKGVEASVGRVEEKLKEIVREGEELPSKFTTFGMILGEVGKDIGKNLIDPLVITIIYNRSDSRDI